ncbi:hypothetical protein [Bordetella bronchiseptica]|uniref:Uncharacterized protein n=1 Tax=Bordetella bronchiseptica 00-P-2796 TaxID=1331199 RepID=A0ABR4R7L3_BORBO|nr:hypothetical protein [Bordetella bronchiseptica]KCV30602.1 hypothetical protein L490_0281 [Bordetella bronchiseptica 00-P-2796]KDB58850.1 hypothetical protein AZ16_0526 [Bordetella bronchiseptica B18-5 (C3)]KDB96705.1 hypothetical protein AZ18_0427 [Bordetella bronchiseptica D993]KDC08362.1 hypothetical protein AZ19_0527 [Bordetella bronchiseptica E012]KDC71136.1 hypothetical protein L512_0511 [Bordetella bronchiseptica MBORD624]
MRTDSLGREELLSVSHQNDIEAVNLYLDYVAFAYLVFFAGFNQISARHREPLLEYAVIFSLPFEKIFPKISGFEFLMNHPNFKQNYRT